MNKNIRFLFSTILLTSTACSTMSESLRLGGGIGALGGAAATYASQSSGGQTPSFGNVALGASIGMGIGLLSSYIVHRKVEEDRQSFFTNQIDMHFGDLPPSPFVIPQATQKKGSK